MKVLLVNAFPNNKHGRKRFEEYVLFVKHAFEPAKHMDADSIEFMTKDRTELDPFIFEMQSAFMDPTSLHRFDQLDFIFVGGECRALPWDKSMKKLHVLLKMCLDANKCVFGGMVACQALAFQLNCSGQWLQSEDPKGSHITSLKNTPPPPEDHVVIGSNTGQYFSFDSRRRKWRPGKPLGLRRRVSHGAGVSASYVSHSSVSALDSNSSSSSNTAFNFSCYGNRNSRGSRSSGPALARFSNPPKRVYGVMPSGPQEIVCCMREQHHPLFKGLSSTLPQFVVRCTAQWRLQPNERLRGGEVESGGSYKFGGRDCSHRYVVLADSTVAADYGPLLIERGNVVASLFTLSPKTSADAPSPAFASFSSPASPSSSSPSSSPSSLTPGARVANAPALAILSNYVMWKLSLMRQLNFIDMSLHGGSVHKPLTNRLQLPSTRRTPSNHLLPPSTAARTQLLDTSPGAHNSAGLPPLAAFTLLRATGPGVNAFRDVQPKLALKYRGMRKSASSPTFAKRSVFSPGGGGGGGVR